VEGLTSVFIPEKMENTFHQSESRFKTLTESAPVGIFGTDLNGVTNYVNQRWSDITGMSSVEALGIGWIDAIHPDDRIRVAEVWKKASSTSSKSISEFRFLHTDGSVSWVKGLAVPQNDQSGNMIGYVGTITDITERISAEEKLIESEAYYRTLIDISPDGIVTIDLTGNVTYGSKKAYEIFNEPADLNLKGKTVYNWIDPEYHARLKKRLQEIVGGSLYPVTGEYKLMKRDKTVFWAEMSSCPITDAKGKTNGLLVVCRDISERKKAEEELIKARDKAEEGDKLKTAFLHNISHEIRTPMNAITGFSALLTEPDLSKETQLSYVDIINQSSDHLLFVLNDIIEISNLDAGILKLKKNETNLNALLTRLYDQFMPLAADKKIEFGLITGFSDKEANIIIDSGKLIQVLSNLLRNSLKFTSKGKIEFGYQLKEGFLEFYVLDTGIGIHEDQLLKIFNRFYQVEHTETRSYDGTGLGLSISKEYIDLMNGEIWLNSKPGNGSVFYFTIPYEETKILQTINHPSDLMKIQELTEKKTILIAEDDNNNFRLIKQLLSGLNIEIVHAGNGIEAVDICKSGKRIDLILMDIKMPLMDGYEASRQILLQSPSMKIIVQTAYADDIARSLKAGCVGFISKPFNRKQFVRLVEDYL
jgi:PAS domain S-box-containing protein